MFSYHLGHCWIGRWFDLFISHWWNFCLNMRLFWKPEVSCFFEHTPIISFTAVSHLESMKFTKWTLAEIQKKTPQYFCAALGYSNSIYYFSLQKELNILQRNQRLVMNSLNNFCHIFHLTETLCSCRYLCFIKLAWMRSCKKERNFMN